MWFKNFRSLFSGKPATGATARSRQARRHTSRINLEQLEERSLLSDFAASNVLELIAAIDAANLTPEADTIALAPATRFTLTARNNSTHGGNGLPVVAPGEDLTIVGNGATLERVSAASFRLFNVSVGASLHLENLTLQGGRAYGTGASAQGGAIYSAGDLSLRDVIVQNNVAQGADFASPGRTAAGGGLYSAGSLDIEGGVIRDNQAIGGRGMPSIRVRDKCTSGCYTFAQPGGNGLGGGVYVASGTATLSDVTLTGNAARGGNGGAASVARPAAYGGAGQGGGIHLAGGTVAITNTVVSANTAQGGTGGSPTLGYTLGGKGGGVYINSAALVTLDVFTRDHTTGNTASTSDPDISGSYGLV